MRLWLIIFFIIGISVPFSALAETMGASVKAISLTIISRSLRACPSVEAAQAALRASMAELKESEALTGWAVTGKVGLGEHVPLVTSAVTPSYFGTQFSAGLSYPILGSMALEKEQEADARLGVVSQEELLDKARRVALLALRRDYIAYWLAWKDAHAAESWREWLELRRHAVNVEYQQGFWSRNQVQVFKISLVQAKAQESAFRQQAYAALANITGLTGVKYRLYPYPMHPDLPALGIVTDLAARSWHHDAHLALLKAQLKALLEKNRNSHWQHIDGALTIWGGNIYDAARGRSGYQAGVGLKLSAPLDFLQADHSYHTKVNASIQQVRFSIRAERLARQADVEGALSALKSSRVFLYVNKTNWKSAISAYHSAKIEFYHGNSNMLSKFISSRENVYASITALQTSQAKLWQRLAKLDCFVGNERH